MSAMITLEEACQFLWREAELLDRRDYDNWLTLWQDDGLYIIPINRSVSDHENHLNYLYDDAKMRQMRVARLRSTQSMSALAAAETVRTVSRFVVEDAAADSISVRAAQHLYEYRNNGGHLLAADVAVTLKRCDGTLKLARKVVTLINSEDALRGIAYLL